ncbi:MAG: hypothetical protein WBE58_22080 [Verrucomicrobiales bacterium]|nr:hypothetical protein [Verrucomicrobiales bacterium]
MDGWILYLLSGEFRLDGTQQLTVCGQIPRCDEGSLPSVGLRNEAECFMVGG